MIGGSLRKPAAERKSPADLKASQENPTPKSSGAGSRVPDSKLFEAAEHYLTLEEKTGKAPALHVARKLGLSVAPEWLESPRFKQVLEVTRFRRKVLAMAAQPEIAGTISELISLGLLEAHRRLILNASDIPSTVLYGDILHKWPKMLREMAQGAKPVAAENVFISIVKEINLISDPEAREKMRKQILGSLDDAASVLSGAKTGDVKEDVVDGELVESGPVRNSGVHLLAESVRPVDSNPAGASGSSSVSGDPSLWDDPALD